jgi:Sulfatase-modifying factor enzyme 1
VPRLIAFVVVSLSLFPVPDAHAASASDFGRAQTQKNSYEARRAWRERNVKAIQFGTIQLPAQDNTPRTSDEITAETDRVMKAMENKWSNRDTRTLQEIVNDGLAAADRRAQVEYQEFQRKGYPKLMKKLRTAALKSDADWKRFYDTLNDLEKNELEMGLISDQSPLAEIGNAYRPMAPELARQIYKRGLDINDSWSFLNLGLLEAAQGTPEGLARAFELFRKGIPQQRYLPTAAVACKIELTRAYAFGLGVTADPRKAVGLMEEMRQSSFMALDAKPSYRTGDNGKLWTDFYLLEAALRRNGTGYPKDPAAANVLLQKALNYHNEYSWIFLTGLLQAGEDIADKKLSWRILSEATRNGHLVGGGYQVLKWLRGEGVEANPKEAYSLAMRLEGMDPVITAEVARLLMLVSRANAAAVIERHALPSDIELQSLLSQAKGLTPPVAVATALREEPAKVPGLSRVTPVSGSTAAVFGWIRIPDGNGIKAFELAKTEVTNKQYRACVEAGACTPPSTYIGTDDYPVVNVDWAQAKAFSAWAGGRLPTEAEWVHAARSGGMAQEYPWGNNEATCETAAIRGCGTGAAPACSKPQGNTAQGLCDMAGNVWEWTGDWFNGAPADSAASPGTARVFRGGSWKDSSGAAKANFRDGNIPSSSADNVGLRPAR